MCSRSKKLMNSSNTILFVLMAVSILMQGSVASGVNIVQDKLSSIEQAATARVKSDTIREVVTTLSSKEMEGRGAAQAGGEKAAQYLAERFAKAGLKPLGDGRSYQQQIKVEVQTLMPGTELKVGGNTLRFKQDF